VVSVSLQQTLRRLRSFSFQGLVRSVYSESTERNYAILFDWTERQELSTLPVDCGL